MLTLGLVPLTFQLCNFEVISQLQHIAKCEGGRTMCSSVAHSCLGFMTSAGLEL